MDESYRELVLRGVIDCPPCSKPMQNHLRKKFLDAQGPSMKDASARVRRTENARRYARWAETSSLSSRGERAI